ncbi:hypothetical protein Droror1_Dr00014395 [Drosera rotundifolia]
MPCEAQREFGVAVPSAKKEVGAACDSGELLSSARHGIWLACAPLVLVERGNDGGREKWHDVEGVLMMGWRRWREPCWVRVDVRWWLSEEKDGGCCWCNGEAQIAGVSGEARRRSLEDDEQRKSTRSNLGF